LNWPPVFTGVTTFYEIIKIEFANALPQKKVYHKIKYFEIRIISKMLDRIFYEGLARPRKARQIAPQASAGYCLV
jgi:hypothetical protein